MLFQSTANLFWQGVNQVTLSRQKRDFQKILTSTRPTFLNITKQSPIKRAPSHPCNMQQQQQQLLGAIKGSYAYQRGWGPKATAGPRPEMLKLSISFSGCHNLLLTIPVMMPLSARYLITGISTQTQTLDCSHHKLWICSTVGEKKYTSQWMCVSAWQRGSWTRHSKDVTSSKNK